VPRLQKVYSVAAAAIWPNAGRGRPRKQPVPSEPGQDAASALADQPWRHIAWRHGTKGPLAARFAALRVRVADGPPVREGKHLPGEEVWLVGEWRRSGERKYYLSNLPHGASLRKLAATIKARWLCEQAHQQLKQELGLGAFEVRSWTGLHRHALMSCIAFAYLQHTRLKQVAARGKKADNRDCTAATKVA
jgi:SRSO17 transposase